MDGKRLTSLFVVFVLLFSSADETEARLCIGSRHNCYENPKLASRGVTCSGVKPGHVCRGYGWHGCRCLLDLTGRMFAAEATGIERP